jgi:hypothetical protein
VRVPKVDFIPNPDSLLDGTLDKANAGVFGSPRRFSARERVSARSNPGELVPLAFRGDSTQLSTCGICHPILVILSERRKAQENRKSKQRPWKSDAHG